MNTAGKPGSNSNVQVNHDKIDTALSLNCTVPFCVACSVVPNVNLTHSWARGSSEWNPSHQYNFKSNDLRLTTLQSGLLGPCSSTIATSFPSQQSGLPHPAAQLLPLVFPRSSPAYPDPAARLLQLVSPRSSPA